MGNSAERNREWRAANPEKVRAQRERARLREKGLLPPPPDARVKYATDEERYKARREANRRAWAKKTRDDR